MDKKNLFNLIFVLIFLSGAGLACTALREITSQPQQSTTTTTTTTPAPTPTATPTPDTETAELKEKIEELEKKIEEQKKQPAQPPVVIKPNPPAIRETAGTARVNSPNDGFLALRSEPNAETGYRILQIPHGARVRVHGCLGYTERVGGRNGRWCRVSYAGYTGWAFDGWLVY